MSLADAARAGNRAILQIMADRELAKRQAMQDELMKMRGMREDRELDLRERGMTYDLEEKQSKAAAQAQEQAEAKEAYQRFLGSVPASMRPVIEAKQFGVSADQHDFEDPSAHQAHVEADEQRKAAAGLSDYEARRRLDRQYAAPKEDAFENWRKRYDYELANPKPTAAERSSAGGEQTQQQANEVEDALTLIKNLEDDPAFGAAVGPIDAYIGKARDLEGVTRFDNRHKELIGKLSLAQAGKLKGQGQISNIERELLKNAATALSRNLGEGDYKAELAKIRAQFERMKQPAAGGGGGPVPMVAPDGRSLMVPAADVARMEALGAKRR